MTDEARKPDVDPHDVDPRSAGAICSSCAEAHGGGWQDGHMATFWVGRCGLCGARKSVTSTSDYLWPRLGKRRLDPNEVD